MILSVLAVYVKLYRLLHDILKRYMVLGGDAATVLVLWSVVRYRPVHRCYFQSYIAPASCNRHPLTGEYLALFLALPNPKRRSLGEDQMLQFRGVLGAAENSQKHSRAILLHLYRQAESIQRAFLQKSVDDIAKNLRVQVVEICF